MFDVSCYPQALAMARQGATRGMIVRKLREQRVRDHVAQEVADRALAAVANSIRIKGLGQILLGLIVLGSAVAVLLFIGTLKISVILAMCGAGIVVLGMVNLTHRGPATSRTASAAAIGRWRNGRRG